MIDTSIPNPLTDRSVGEDIRDRVDYIMDHPARIGSLDIIIRNAVTRAAEWGMQEGFRLGWRVHETRSQKPQLTTP